MARISAVDFINALSGNKQPEPQKFAGDGTEEWWGKKDSEDNYSTSELEERISDVVKSRLRDISEEVERMLPRSDGGAAPQSSDGGRGRRKSTMDYLQNGDSRLSKSPTEGRILAVRLDDENRFGPRVIVKLAMLGKTLFWGVNVKKNPNYQLLEERFGNDENDWVDQTIALHLEQDSFSGNYNTRVTFPEKVKRGR